MYQDKKSMFEKVAVGLDMEKQSLEKDCNQFQVIYSIPFFYSKFYMLSLFVGRMFTRRIEISLSTKSY